MLEDWLGPACFGIAVDALDAALLTLGPTFSVSVTHVWGQLLSFEHSLFV